MVTKYQKFGDGYKAEAVKLYRESNQTIAETARNLGLKESTLANGCIFLGSTLFPGVSVMRRG